MANLRVDKITSTETFETTGSVQFDGTGDYLSIPNSNDFAFGTGDFTIEMWLYASSSGSYQTPIDFRPTATNGNYPALIRDTDGDLYYFVNSSRLIDNVSISNHVWYHVAICREGTTTRLYLDGVLKGSASDSTNYITDDINISSYKTGGNYFHGYISNLRVIKGKALYTANFKPPMRELENIPGTVLLCCQSKTDATLEKTGKTITVTGPAVASELTPGLLTPIPKAGAGSAITGSVEFDGTGDCLTAPDGSDFEFGSDNFTIEAYIYYTGSPGTGSDTYVITSKWDNQSAPNDKGLILRISDDGSGDNLQWFYTTDGSTNDITTGSTILIPESWYHIAFVRNGTIGTFYINGIADATTVSFGSDSIRDTGNPFRVGANLESGAIDQEFQGFISNLRVIKGTALYTGDFIPPTRELKKVPGTVLLCCQDPDNPLTEATGKTITGYGSLQQDSPELVTDGEFESASNWSSAESDWTVGSGQAVINSSNSGYDYLGQLATGLLNGEQYELVFNVTNYSTGRLELSQSSSGNMGVESPNGRNVFRFTYTGTTGGAVGLYSYTANTASFTLTNVSLKRVFASKSGSNFTPQVGDDRKVTFEGVTKINSDAYFYLPTGNTESRYPIGSGGAGAGTRGVMFGGYYDSSPNRSDVIDYVTIASTGNAVDFGDRLNTTDTCAACASATRALNAGGYDGSATINTIEYVTIASTGNASKFGELDLARRNRDGCSSSTRGLFGGGYPTDDAMEYVTIATSGISSLFGNLTVSRYNLGALASPVRGVFGGGTPSTDTMDFVTIATTADAIDFGNLTAANGNVAGTSSETRGIFGFSNNVINYITIASTGDAIDFGDLNYNPNANACTSSLIRGIFMGGGTPARVNTISYITIASTGNAVDFGDLTQARQSLSATSSGHGGLG